MVAARTHTALSRHFFADLAAGRQTLTGEAVHHLRDVRRVRPGQQIVLFDGQGLEARATIVTVGSDRIEVDVTAPQRAGRESPLALTLAFALSKGDKPEWICQKAVELGVSSLIVFAAERSVARWTPARTPAKLDRLTAAIRGACAQSGRAATPPVHYAASFDQALNMAQNAALRIALSPTAEQSLDALLATSRVESVCLLTGPEGGLAPLELQLLAENDWRLARFGPRILRAETSTLAAIAVLQHALGDLR